MTDQDMIDSSRALVVALMQISDSKGFGVEDRVAFACMALPEFIAQQIGPVAMIERLRNVADVMERQFLN